MNNEEKILQMLTAMQSDIAAIKTEMDHRFDKMDERLNEHGYIVPGLGDAGDRIFGTK